MLIPGIREYLHNLGKFLDLSVGNIWETPPGFTIVIPQGGVMYQATVPRVTTFKAELHVSQTNRAAYLSLFLKVAKITEDIREYLEQRFLDRKATLGLVRQCRPFDDELNPLFLAIRLPTELSQPLPFDLDTMGATWVPHDHRDWMEKQIKESLIHHGIEATIGTTHHPDSMLA